MPDRIEQCPCRCPSAPGVRCQQLEGHPGVHWAVGEGGRAYAWTPRRDERDEGEGHVHWPLDSHADR